MTSTDLDATSVESRAAVLAAVGDPARLRILDVLGADTKCVCDIQQAVAIAPNLLSYHLGVLRAAGLVVASRRSRWVDYRLSDDAAGLVAEALPAPLAG
ncbi:MAG TPA: metalloregulator ArsR/SmtB family transcription factor [Acidimicrobiia bacterium]